MLLLFILGVSCFNIILAKNASSINTSEDDSDGYYPIEDWSDTFDWQLLKAISAQPYRNVLISPISLKLTLALLYEGSSGLTEKEFQHILQFPVQKQVVREKFYNILHALQSSERSQYILNLGTNIFLDSSISPQQKFQAKAKSSYRTDMQQTNFSNPIEASHTINSWVDILTNGRIPELVNSGDLQDAIMMIANVIYFKGTWLHQFPKNQTKEGGFYVDPKTVVKVNYMTTTAKFFYFESSDLDAKIIRLPYRGHRYALFMVLPNSKGGLPDLIKKINLQVLKRHLYFMDPILVEVTLPKFKFNFQTRYSKILQEFGLQQMFQNTASFPGIARGQPHLLRMLVVSDILQKTGIELDEEGSVIYAATDVQVGSKFGEADHVFNATHPFLFFIEEATTGSILFVGKVENPLESDVVPLPSRFGDNENGGSKTQEANYPQPVAASYPNLQPPNPEKETLINRFSYFDLELLKEFHDSTGNVFISPASIKATLALILEGAKGSCAEEIANALYIHNSEPKDMRDLLSRLLNDLNDRGQNTVLESANAVFVSDRYRIYDEYRNKVSNHYKAMVTNVNFADSANAANAINNWVSSATSGLIKELINQQTLNSETTLVLSNALFFKGKWKIAFDPTASKPKCFNLTPKHCVNITFMEVGDTFKYNLVSGLNAHAVELPYQDDKYSMLVLIPAGNNSIKDLTRDMQRITFSYILEQLKPTDITFEMPTFKMDFSADLIEYLKKLRIQEVFGSKANLTGIIPNENVKISNIIHKTYVEVNEQGTRAAAATGAIVIPLMGTTALKIRADRPFLFFIFHKESNNIIFEGIFREPSIEQQYSLPRANTQYVRPPFRRQ